MESINSRRNFIKTTSAALALTAIGGNAISKGVLATNAEMLDSTDPMFVLPQLPYAYDALEPYIDKQTMVLHHTKHHQAYITNLNKALVGKEVTNVDIAKFCTTIDANTNAAIRNNAGGHYNHSLYWTLMIPGGKIQSKGAFNTAFNATFGNIKNFEEKFTAAAMSRFGSGWAWLVLNKGKLEIVTTPNQDNPLMPLSDVRGTPLLALDVWEHAYYLKHQNVRMDYINAWYNIVNWEQVESLYLKAK